MPVRKIPKNYRSITGNFPSLKNGRNVAFESSLERDLFLTLEFDPSVVSYEEQPVKLSGSVSGRKVEYTPDCLVSYEDGKVPLLIEVKYKEDLEQCIEEYQPRFSLATDYTKRHRMEFKVLTEDDIRGNGVRLENYRLLYRFTTPPRNLEECRDHICGIVRREGAINLCDLLKCLSTEKTVQATFTPSIWHLLFIGELEADLDEPIGYPTVMRLYNDNPLS